MVLPLHALDEGPSNEDFNLEPKWVQRQHRHKVNDILKNKVHVLAGVNQAESFVFLRRGDRIEREKEHNISAIAVAIDNGCANMVAGEQTDGFLLILGNS